MVNLIMTGKEEDLEKLTGLDREGLWNAGFNLDDWDVCFISDIPLHSEALREQVRSDWTGEDWEEETYDLECDYEYYDDVHWLFWQMDSYCVGFNHVEYNGKHYYTVHHS